MHNHSPIAIAIALAATLSFGAAQAAPVIVNIDATTAGVTVTESFDAGTYDVTWIGASNGGLYDAWGAAVTGSGDHAKYRDAFAVSFNGAAPQNFGDFGPYAPDTAASALGYAQAHPATFNFTTATIATFSIPDYKFDDNSGGVSLAITAAVPEPETYALMLGGLGILGFVARRRKGV